MSTIYSDCTLIFIMASINNLKQNKNKINSLEYLKCFSEGMKEWLEIKAKAGNEEIKQNKLKLSKEIKESSINMTPRSFSKKIANEMNSLGIRKETVIEFKGIFRIRTI